MSLRGPILRRFVEVDGRTVHYRISGSGPLVLLVHQSPRSSAEYQELMTHLAAHYTVIAPDNPGNGLSEPLPKGHREINGYGDGLARFLDALNVKRCLLYGFHTGASIALAFASRHPKRVAHVVLNGLTVSTKAEAEEYTERYLPAFQPSWDGAHLTWAWARLREQLIFFPWYKSTESARMAIPHPDSATHTASVLEFLRPGDAYRHAYGAAFRTDTATLVKTLTCPATLISMQWDPLYNVMERLTDIPAHIKRLRLGMGFKDYLPYLEAAFKEFSDKADQSVDSLPDHECIFVDGIRARVRAGNTGKPLLILHDFADDSDGVEVNQLVSSFSMASSRQIVTLDLPGHGETIVPFLNMNDACERIKNALHKLNIKSADVVGLGLGAVVGKHLGVNYTLNDHSRMPDIDHASHDEGVEILQRWSEVNDMGAHLLAAWRLARDQALFQPWYQNGPDAVRAPAGSVDPVDIHRKALAAIKSMPSWPLAFAAMAQYES